MSFCEEMFGKMKDILKPLKLFDVDKDVELKNELLIYSELMEKIWFDYMGEKNRQELLACFNRKD